MNRTIATSAENNVRDRARVLVIDDDASIRSLLVAVLKRNYLVVVANAHDSLVTLTGQETLPEDRRAWVEWSRGTTTPFAARREFMYPVFHRDKRWLDYVPFMPPVPNELPGKPNGLASQG